MQKQKINILWKDGEIAYTEDDGKTFVTVPRGTPVSMNFWGFTESFMKELEKRFPKFLEKALTEDPLKAEFYLPMAVEELLEEGKARVRMLKTRDKWYGVTYHEDKEDVVNALQALKDKGIYPPKLWL